MSKKTIAGLAWLAVAVVGIIAWFGLASTVPDSKAYDAAKGLGYTDVHVSDRSFAFSVFGGCDKGDVVKWQVSGTNPAGQHVNFTVCAGYFKGGTPRF